MTLALSPSLLHPALAPDRLLHLWTVLEPHMPRIMDNFYNHYIQIAQFAEILKGHEVASLKKAQTIHWGTTCREGINESYIARCRRIGQAHARIGLTEDYFCSAYGMIIHFARDAIIGDANWRWGLASWRVPRLRALESLYQLVIIDIASCISAYSAAVEDKSWDHISTVCSGLSTATSHSELRIRDSNLSVQAAQSDSTEASQKIAALVNQSRHIEDILKLIHDVAEQTNLLSLNARIEAARAGDAGRGFSIVAEEVKKLSIRVQQATGDIAKQIGIMKDMATDANKTVQNIDTHMAKVNESITAVTQAFTGQQQAIGYIQERGRSLPPN